MSFLAPGPATTPPAWVRFLIAALWTFVVFRGSGFVFELMPRHNLLPGLLYRAISCALCAAGYLLLMRILDLNDAPVPIALGLPLDATALRQWVVGLIVGMELMLAIALVITVFGGIRFHLHMGPHMMARTAAVLVLLLFGALMEELAFRGYPFQKLTESVGALGAVLLLSALFGAIHLMNPEAGGWLSWGFFNTIAVGVIFALARIRTGSLWFPFGLHFGWNLFQGVVCGLPVSGLTEFSTVITASTQGPAALTGGSYGPEASATCSVILLVALPVTWYYTSSRKVQHQPWQPEKKSAAATPGI